MKRYIRNSSYSKGYNAAKPLIRKYAKAMQVLASSSDKPLLDKVQVVWTELENGTGLMYSIYSDNKELLFEEIFDYQDVDPDMAYESAYDMAVAVLSQKYELSDDVINTIKGE